MCPECRAERSYLRVVVRRRFRVPAVPGIPLGRYGEFVECQSCRSTFRPEVLAYGPDARSADSAAEYQRAMKRVLALMVVSDGKVHGREVETVQAVYEAVTGRRLGRAEVSSELDAVAEEPVSVARYLARAMGYLNEYGKEQILRACVLVSHADGRVHEREAEMMRHLGGVMRMDPAAVERVVRELGGR